jgi:hypothetical protein
MALSEPEHLHRLGIAQPMSARAAAGPDLNVETGEHEVVASIQATFALESA